jgi:hypothetical protein
MYLIEVIYFNNSLPPFLISQFAMNKNTFLLILCIAACIHCFSQNSTELYHRAKIFYNTSDQLITLAEKGIPVDHGKHIKNVFFESDFSASEIEQIRALGFQVEIIINDVIAHYVNQNNPKHKEYVAPNISKNAACPNTVNSIVTPTNFDVKPGTDFGGYYTYSEALQELDDMATLFPNLITVKAEIGPAGNPFLTEGEVNTNTTPSIGSNPIYWVKISDNPTSSTEGEPQVLYTAIHHAREPMSLQQLIFYMWYLLENYDSDPVVKGIVDTTELYFIPVINPDGYLHIEHTNPEGGGLWRKNRKINAPGVFGVDNNRNYDCNITSGTTWGGAGASADPSADTYHGTSAFSEIENQAVKWFVEQHNFVLAINHHSFGEYISYPFGYANVATPDESIFQNITNEMTFYNQYDAVRNWPFAGNSDDFMYATVGTHNKILSMTAEVGDVFWPAASRIEDICKEVLFSNLVMAQIAGNYSKIRDNTPLLISNTTTDINYILKRLGLEDNGNFTVSVTPVSANIVSVGGANTHSNLSFAQEVAGTIQLNLDTNISAGDPIVYDYVINNGDYDITIRETKFFGQPVTLFTESGDGILEWATNGWGATTEDFAPGSPNSSITDSPNSNYSANQNRRIILTTPIDLTNIVYAYLTFEAKWEIQNNFDYAQLEVSTDGGFTWIPQCGNYTNTGVQTQSGANGEPVYDGLQSTWVTERINLNDYLGETIVLRFTLDTNGSINQDGFYFDNLKVESSQNNLSTDEFAVNTFTVYPNPVQNQLFIKSTENDYDIKIHNMLGQLIFERDHNTGDSSINYAHFSKGVYILSISNTSKKSILKIIKE